MLALAGSSALLAEVAVSPARLREQSFSV